MSTQHFSSGSVSSIRRVAGGLTGGLTGSKRLQDRVHDRQALSTHTSHNGKTYNWQVGCVFPSRPAGSAHLVRSWELQIAAVGSMGDRPWISRALADAIVGSKQLGIGARLPRRSLRKGCRQPGVCRRADCELRARVEPGDSGARGSVRFELCAELVGGMHSAFMSSSYSLEASSRLPGSRAPEPRSQVSSRQHYVVSTISDSLH